MRRRITIALLAFGTFAGYGSGIAHVVHHARHAPHSCPHWADPSPSPSDPSR
ncbi:MAG: hypothetical protein WBY94_06115 [Polyangiaceae bacterium]